MNINFSSPVVRMLIVGLGVALFFWSIGSFLLNIAGAFLGIYLIYIGLRLNPLMLLMGRRSRFDQHRW